MYKGIWYAMNTKGIGYGDCGYVLVGKNGNYMSSQFSCKNDLSKLPEENLHLTITIVKPFAKLDISLPLVAHSVSFKFFSKYFLQFDVISHRFGKLIKKMKLGSQKNVGFKLHRQLR